jgi:PST family polysaccharide transporter
MAMAAVVTNFGFLFKDLGTSAAIIQLKEVRPNLLDAVFWMSLFVGTLIAATVAIIAPLAAWVFSNETLVSLLLVLSLIFPIGSAAAAQLAMLERQNKFRSVAWIEVSSAALGLVIGIIFAVMDYGVFSLAIQALVSVTVSTVQLWLASSWRPSLSCRFSELRKIWQFSGNLVLFNIINYFARNVDSMLVGRWLGADNLGWYSIANRLLLFPIQNLSGVVGRALLPVYSRQQESLGHLYLRTLALVSALSAPMMFGLWGLREALVVVFLGANWGPVAEILAWFAPMGIFQSLLSTTGTVLIAIGRTDILRKIGIVNTATLVGAFVLGLQWGLMGLVTVYFFATVVLFVSTMYIVLKQINLSFGAMLRHIAAPVLSALGMGLILVASNMLLAPMWSDLMRLLILGPLSAMVYVLSLWMFAPHLIKDFATIAGIRT